MDNNVSNAQKENITLDFSKTNINSIEDLEAWLKASKIAEIGKFQKELGDKIALADKLKLRIESYKASRDKKGAIQKEVKDLETILSKINKALDGSKDLVFFRKKVQEELAKFAQFNNSNDIDFQVGNIKNQRIDGLVKRLVSLGRPIQQREVVINQGLVGKIIPIIVLLQVFFSIIFFLASNRIEILNLGIFTIIINFALFFSINLNKGKSTAIAQNFQTTQQSEMPENVNESVFLVNAAWTKALKRELANLDSSLASRLHAAGVDNASMDIDTLSNRIIKLNTEIDSFYNNEISPEDYLRTRRELDLLEIELQEIQPKADQSNNIVLNIYNVGKLNKDLSDLVYNYLEHLKTKIDVRFIDETSNVPMQNVTPNKLFTTLSLILIIFSFVLAPLSRIYAKSAAEIGQEIIDQNNQLKNAEEQLNNAQNELEQSRELLAQSEEGLPKIEAEIKKIESEMEVNESKLKVIEDKKALLDLRKEEKKIVQQSSLKSSYMEWRADSDIANVIGDDENNSIKNQRYGAILLGIETNNLEGLIDEIEKIEKEIADYEKALAELGKSNEDLQAKKAELQSQISYFANSIESNTYLIGNLQSSIKDIQSQIEYLNAEQKSAIEREKQILQGPGNVDSAGCDGATVDNDKFYICGNGRDLYQGHGVGLSQWGAYGMALNHGFNYQNILTFYYSGVSVTGGYEGYNINVDGYGSMNIENYVSGLAEVPDKACGNSAQASANPSKYVVDNPNTIWDCWPEETIKAQVVIARTYGIYHGSVCTTSACQVYQGGSAKAWAANETKGQVLKYGGSLIEAVYSSDNNQGNGTADNDTIWQDFSGYGTAYPYLRSVNDNAYAAYTSWTFWPYKTQTYNISELNNLLSYVANSPEYSSSIRGQASAIISTIGNISYLEFERDASSRVKKVWFVGTNGQRRSIGGWWFKNIWNSWIFDTKGNGDYIYSQTFYMI